MPEDFTGDAYALFQRKERALVRAMRHADHELIEDVGCSAHQILVAPGHWIESAGIDRDDHASSLFCPLPALDGPIDPAHYGEGWSQGCVTSVGDSGVV